MNIYYLPHTAHIEMQLFRLTLHFLSQSFQLFQALRNCKRTTASFILKGCVIPTNCPFSNLKETDVCNSVSNCSALLCASPFCALPALLLLLLLHKCQNTENSRLSLPYYSLSGSRKPCSELTLQASSSSWAHLRASGISALSLQ